MSGTVVAEHEEKLNNLGLRTRSAVSVAGFTFF